MEKATTFVADAFECSRAGIWIFDGVSEKQVLKCLGIYDRSKGRMTLAPDEARESVQPYFEALYRDGHVLAVDAATHPATKGFFADRLAASGVRISFPQHFALMVNSSAP